MLKQHEVSDRIDIDTSWSDLAVTDTHGGALVNLIHSYTENGDPFVRHFTDQLLEEVCNRLSH